ncbi:MAG: phage terminase large subunit, partial [Methylocella sp.]
MTISKIPFNLNNAKQQDFLRACKDPQFTHIAYIGGRGSGKTTALCRVFLEAVDLYPGIRLALTAESYPKLKDSTLRAFLDMLHAGNIDHEYHRTDEIISFSTGSQILFRSHDNPDRLRGPEFAFIGIDEARNTSEAAYLVSVGELRQAGFPHKIIIATTPRGSRHWSAKYFINAATRLPNSIAIRASSYDNAENLPQNYIPMLESTYTGSFARQEIYGDLVIPSGLVYDAFNPSLHVIPSIVEGPPSSASSAKSADKKSLIYCGLDFGTRHPVAAIWLAVPPSGELTVIDEYKRGGLSADIHAREILA